MTKIDLDRVKEQVDLLAIIGIDTNLKRVASTNGGEWAGPCPFCDGRDRFRVQPYAKPYPLWMCRQCCGGKWDTVIGFIARRDNLDPTKRVDLGEICRRVVGDIPTSNCQRSKPPAIPAYTPPASDWQAAAHQIVNDCEIALWDPKYKTVLEYLRRRGLRDETIRNFRLGYCPTEKKDVYGREIAGLYVQRGIVIPCIVAGEVWYLKTRLVPGLPCRCQNKDCGAILAGPGRCKNCGEDNRYRGVKGNRPAAIYNADSLSGATMALFCEGEFNCMIAHQEISEIIPTVTLGSATNHPDLATWGAHLFNLRLILNSYDQDQAGKKGAEALENLVGDRSKLLRLPEGVKDINDFHLLGGNLLDWILEPIRSWKGDI